MKKTTKKLAAILTIVLMLISLVPVGAKATDKSPLTENDRNERFGVWEDGSYLVSYVSSESLAVKGTAQRILGNKTIECRNSDDELLWKYVLTGTFDVTYGVSSVCIDSTYSYEIYGSGWSLTDHSNSYSGNHAYGTASFKKKILFITTTTRDISASIGCDKNGIVG